MVSLGRLRIRHALRRQGHCAICGTRLCEDDALGLAASQLVHAECALVSFLMSSGEDPSSADVRGAARDADETCQAVFAKLSAARHYRRRDSVQAAEWTA